MQYIRISYQQVRAGSLQELVYKGGQAGVIKATVTITFDNTDKHQSPVGYDSFDEITVSRQVVIGGRNKYLINGSNALPSRVQDLFRSVQLNVNNPHFLIMQVSICTIAIVLIYRINKITNNGVAMFFIRNLYLLISWCVCVCVCV